MEVKSKNILNALIPELGSAAGSGSGALVKGSPEDIWRKYLEALFIGDRTIGTGDDAITYNEYYKLYSYLLEVKGTSWPDGTDRIIPNFQNADIPPQYKGGSLHNLLAVCADAGQRLSSPCDTQFVLDIPDYGTNIYFPDSDPQGTGRLFYIQSYIDASYVKYTGYDGTKPVKRLMYLEYYDTGGGAHYSEVESVSKGLISMITSPNDTAARFVAELHKSKSLRLFVYLPASKDSWYLLVPNDANALQIGKQTIPFDSSSIVVTSRPTKYTQFSVSLSKQGDWGVSDLDSKSFPGGNDKTTALVDAGYNLKFKLTPKAVQVKYSLVITSKYTDITITLKSDPTKVVSVNDKFLKGTELVLTATPKKGYRFKEWNYAGDITTDIKRNITVNNNVYISAESVLFDTKAKVTATFGGDGEGTIMFNPAPAKLTDNYIEVDLGTTVTVSANPATGQNAFDGWDCELPEGCVATSSTLTFVVKKDWALHCKFKKTTSETVSIQPQVAFSDYTHVTLYISKNGVETELKPTVGESTVTYPATLYNKGDKGYIRAAMADGWKFDYWGDHTTKGAMYNFTAGDEAVAVINSDTISISMMQGTSFNVTFNVLPATLASHIKIVNGVNKQSLIGTHTYAAGSRISVEVTIDDGYSWDGWSTHKDQGSNFVISSLSEAYTDTANIKESVLTVTALANCTSDGVDAHGTNQPIYFYFDGSSTAASTKTYKYGDTCTIVAQGVPSNYVASWDEGQTSTTPYTTSFKVTSSVTRTLTYGLPTDAWILGFFHAALGADDIKYPESDGTIHLTVPEHNAVFYYMLRTKMPASSITITEVKAVTGRDGNPATSMEVLGDIGTGGNHYVLIALKNIGYFDYVGTGSSLVVDKDLYGKYTLTTSQSGKMPYTLEVEVTAETNMVLYEDTFDEGRNATIGDVCESLCNVYNDQANRSAVLDVAEGGTTATARFWLWDPADDFRDFTWRWSGWTSWKRRIAYTSERSTFPDNYGEYYDYPVNSIRTTYLRPLDKYEEWTTYPEWAEEVRERVSNYFSYIDVADLTSLTNRTTECDWVTVTPTLSDDQQSVLLTYNVTENTTGKTRYAAIRLWNWDWDETNAGCNPGEAPTNYVTGHYNPEPELACTYLIVQKSNTTE